MFEHWYAVYPLKKNKGRARKNFKAALKNVSSFEVLLNGATRYAESVKAAATPKQFYIHPSNWLSGERWLDEDDIGDQPASEGEWGEIIDDMSEEGQSDAG